MRGSSRSPTSRSTPSTRSTQRVEDAVNSGDEGAFAAALGTLLDSVRSVGTPVADDSLDDSDLILPPADATIDEVRDLLSDDGLIPG